MERVVFASGNAGKVREVAEMLRGLDIDLVPQSDYVVPSVEETGLTFVENALIKARNACEHSGRPAIADDSGLAVDGLDGEPGIYSARYAGEPSDDAANNRRLLEELCDVPEAGWTARFHCVLVYLRHAADPVPLICHGAWEGRVVETPRGSNGFGYDPLFLDPKLDRTAAELEPEVKNRVSHRAKALKALIGQLRDRA
ncbi:MAG TPA: RdgB/HAM1 family non-canonical purine NTP pyrophosphatase [Gammaproteobacteria bacterium]|nr:RdgB/HAM1 family non-canonical purine NTP pyrophosphatase [Gammaproteobacteria bacterium]